MKGEGSGDAEFVNELGEEGGVALEGDVASFGGGLFFGGGGGVEETMIMKRKRDEVCEEGLVLL